MTDTTQSPTIDTVTVQQTSAPTQPTSMIFVGDNSRHLRDTVATAMAAILNFMIFIVLCIFFIPRLENSISATAQNQRVLEANNNLLEKNQEEVKRYFSELEYHRKVIQRLNDALDEAAARAKKLEEEHKKLEKGKKGGD